MDLIHDIMKCIFLITKLILSIDRPLPPQYIVYLLFYEQNGIFMILRQISYLFSFLLLSYYMSLRSVMFIMIST